MSFFGNQANVEKLKTEKKFNAHQLIEQIRKAKVGDKVVYNKVINNFEVYKDSMTVQENDPELIPIGIVVAQNKDFKTTVLIKSFLIENPIRIPFSYAAKEQFIPVYIKQMFDRYKRGFIKRCPNYRKIKRMQLRILQLNELQAFVDYPGMYEIMMNFIGEEKTKEFYNKLNNFKIYVYNQKKLMTWERPKNDQDNDYIKEVNIVGAQILTVFDFQN